MSMCHVADIKDEKSFLETFPRRPLPLVRRALHRLRFPVKCRNHIFRHRFHLHLAGSLDQNPVALFQPGPERRDNLLRVVEKRNPLRRKPHTDRPGCQGFR